LAASAPGCAARTARRRYEERTGEQGEDLPLPPRGVSAYKPPGKSERAAGHQGGAGEVECRVWGDPLLRAGAAPGGAAQIAIETLSQTVRFQAMPCVMAPPMVGAQQRRAEAGHAAEDAHRPPTVFARLRFGGQRQGERRDRRRTDALRGTRRVPERGLGLGRRSPLATGTGR
jgi:hypothetical protein